VITSAYFVICSLQKTRYWHLISDFDLPATNLIKTRNKYEAAAGLPFAMIGAILVFIVEMPETLSDTELEIASISIVNLFIVIVAIIAQYSAGFAALLALGAICAISWKQYKDNKASDMRKYAIAAEHAKVQDYSWNPFEDDDEEYDELAKLKRYEIPMKFLPVSELTLLKKAKQAAGLVPSVRNKRSDVTSGMRLVATSTN
jgi:hypothetical protein